MSKQFEMVEVFNRDILNIPPRKMEIQYSDEFNLSIAQLREEIFEIEKAFTQRSYHDMIDGLIDLNYYLFGIFYKMGIDATDYATVFSIVHEANMKKKLGSNPQRQGFKSADAIKPFDWESPEVAIEFYLNLAKKEKAKEKNLIQE